MVPSNSPVAGDPAGDAAAPVDGRSARRMRNTEAAVDAILELLDEGCRAPTAQLVAERSGLSIRSIFRLFQDMDALHSAAIARQEARFASLFHEVPDTGPLEQRVAALVEHRAELFEAISPVRRHAVRVAPGSAKIRAGLERTNQRFRAQIERVFETELRPLATGGRVRPAGSAATHATVVDALDAAASWETWERLRTQQGLSVVAASKALVLVLSATLQTVSLAAHRPT